MNPRIIVLIVAAVVVALGTAFLVRQFLLGSSGQDDQVQVQTSEILVASRNLPMGHLIEPGDLIWTEWPEDGLNANYLNKEDTKVDELMGNVVRFGITGGEPVTSGRVVSPGQKGFLAAVLGPDMRAVSIPVNRTSGVAGFVFPGDRVDVILTQRAFDDTGIPHQVGETVLKNVRVLAVDLKTDDQKKGNPALGKSVTIEVTPKMAEKVALITRMGRILLALRSLKMVDGQGIEIFSPDEDMPISNAQTHTWDAEVSRIVPPLNPPVQQLVVSRGSQNQVIPIQGGKVLGEDDIRFADVDQSDEENGDQ